MHQIVRAGELFTKARRNSNLTRTGYITSKEERRLLELQISGIVLLSGEIEILTLLPATASCMIALELPARYEKKERKEKKNEEKDEKRVGLTPSVPVSADILPPSCEV